MKRPLVLSIIISSLVFGGCASHNVDYQRRDFASESNADIKPERDCYEDARYESTYTQEMFYDSYKFEKILNKFFEINQDTFQVNFKDDQNVIKTAGLSSLSHSYIMLNDWKKVNCFSGDANFTAVYNLVKDNTQKALAEFYPALAPDERLSLLYFYPWNKRSDWPPKASNKDSISGVLKENHSKVISLSLFKIWSKYNIAFYLVDESLEKEARTIEVLNIFEKEFERFNGSDSQRLKRILPLLQTISLDVGVEEKYGNPTYQGLSLGVANDSQPALSWLLWHELGHSFDHQNSHNSDYIGPFYCTEKYSDTLNIDTDSYAPRKYPLRSFGSYNDFFTSPLSPDDYRRQKNSELASYNCQENGPNKWSESLRQSHYNRRPSEQIADDFAHFVMYPGRYFWNDQVVAPKTFLYFQKKLGTNYIESYSDIFKGSNLEFLEIEHANRIQAALSKFLAKPIAEQESSVQRFFESILNNEKDPMPD
jgi:hypothetical protein